MHIPTKKLLTMILLATFLVVPFQNCGNQFVLREENGLHLMSKGCDAEIFSIFENGFYPFLRQNCSKCHIDGGGGTGFFASPSVIEAWKYFYSDVSKIARNAVNDEHNPPYTGSKHQAVINQLLSSWNKAYQTKKECEIASNPNLDPLQRPFKLVDKQITAMPNSNTFTRISWSLYDEAARDDQKNLVPVTFDIEYRVVTPANQPTRLEFQNPRITVHAGEVELTDLRLLLNGMVLTDVTRYTQIKATFNSATPTPFTPAPNLTFALTPNLTVPFSLAVEFGRVRPNFSSITPPPQPGMPNTPTPQPSLPMRVTYNDLMGNNPALNVFRASCVSCHNQNRADGRLNLEDFARTQLLANTILSRMRNFANPMPRGGLLPADRVNLVQIWVQNGAPRD